MTGAVPARVLDVWDLLSDAVRQQVADHPDRRTFTIKLVGLDPGGLVTIKVKRECTNCERCRFEPDRDCGLEAHPHCPLCQHCQGRHGAYALPKRKR